MLPVWSPHRELFGGVAQLGERTVRIRKVESSILFVSTNKEKDTHPGVLFFIYAGYSGSNSEKATAFSKVLRGTATG